MVLNSQRTDHLLGHAWGTGARKTLVNAFKHRPTFLQLSALLAQQPRMKPWSDLQAGE
jgi:hypothetical protein